MPTCVIAVTTPKSQLPTGFLLGTSAFIAGLLGKPESYVTVRVEPDQMIVHGGSDAPCGSVILYSLYLGRQKNAEYAKQIGDYLEKQLGISAERFYITFVDVNPKDCGYKKSTF